MPLPIGPVVAAAARAIAKRAATRAVGGITGAGAKSVNPTYRQMIASKGKKQAAGYAAGAGGTAAWVGSQVKEHMNSPHFNPKDAKTKKSSKSGGGSKLQKK